LFNFGFEVIFVSHRRFFVFNASISTKFRNFDTRQLKQKVDGKFWILSPAFGSERDALRQVVSAGDARESVAERDDRVPGVARGVG
jgi:hypothetical protein